MEVYTRRSSDFFSPRKMHNLRPSQRTQTLTTKNTQMEVYTFFTDPTTKREKVKIWSRRLPFSEISYVPIVNRRIFRKHTKKDKKRIQYVNIISAERLVQSPSSRKFRRRWIPMCCTCRSASARRRMKVMKRMKVTMTKMTRTLMT